MQKTILPCMQGHSDLFILHVNKIEFHERQPYGRESQALQVDLRKKTLTSAISQLEDNTWTLSKHEL